MNYMRPVVFAYARLFAGFIGIFFNIFQYSVLPISVSRYIYFALMHFCIYISNTKITVRGNKEVFGKNQLLIMTNHYSGLDSCIISSLFQNHTYPLYNVIEANLGGASYGNVLLQCIYSLKSSFVSSFYLIPYKRDDKADGALVKNKIVQTLENGNNLLIFPEGKTSKNGVPHEFKNGIFHLAVDNALQILPITLKYKNVIDVTGTGILKFKEWLDNDVDIYIHDIVQPRKEEGFLSLKERVFNVINRPLLALDNKVEPPAQI